MLAQLQFSPEEKLTQLPQPETVEQAFQLFTSEGYLLFQEVFEPEIIDTLHQAFLALYSRYCTSADQADALLVGNKRVMVTVRLEPPFNDPLLYAHPLILPILKRILGPELILSGFGAVVSLPGSADQQIHRDLSHLFGDDLLDAILPCYALNLLIPLLEVNEENGMTRFWPGSHTVYDAPYTELAKRMPYVDPPLTKGSCLIFDYRIIHLGRANRSAAPRPLLYNTYSRAWFRDPVNYLQQPPLVIPAAEWERIPAEYQPLFTAAKNNPLLGRGKIPQVADNPQAGLQRVGGSEDANAG
ncbi:MAG: phytanoyl-CoA dioxygenase family protein [Thermostichus sp. DG_1_6_bins_120]